MARDAAMGRLAGQQIQQRRLLVAVLRAQHRRDAAQRRRDAAVVAAEEKVAAVDGQVSAAVAALVERIGAEQAGLLLEMPPREVRDRLAAVGTRR